MKGEMPKGRVTPWTVSCAAEVKERWLRFKATEKQTKHIVQANPDLDLLAFCCVQTGLCCCSINIW